MKSSFGKLKKLAFHGKNEAKVKREFQTSAQLDELAQASQDIQEMRNCYDSLLSAAAATANGAYELSESLREMGAFLMDRTALCDDEESGKIFSMLGKVQAEIHKLVDSYRAHIVLTITNPSESLLNELRTVEDMKKQCDEKRDVYEYMVAQHRDKGRLKGGKGESITPEQLRRAHEEFDEEATLCVFRMKSLKQGQSQSLLTQMARHHAAQLNFFRKGVKSLEAVETHMKIITEQNHIEYQFSGLDDDGEYVEDSDRKDYDNASHENLTSRSSMELDPVDLWSRPSSTLEKPEVNLDYEESQFSRRESRISSHSAPIFAEKKFDPAEIRRTQPSSPRKPNTYALPTPSITKGSTPSRTSTSVPRTRPISPGTGARNMWHSSPLEPMHEKNLGNDASFGLTNSKPHSIMRDSSQNGTFIRQVPPPLAEELSLPLHDTFDNKKRQVSSGPVTNKLLSRKLTSGPVKATELARQASGLLFRMPTPQPSASAKVSPSVSPPPGSSPRRVELHELPRPPVSLVAKPERTPGFGHSAPLVSRKQETAISNRISSASDSASPLPTPPLPIARSFSIPSSSQRAMEVHVARLLDAPDIPEKLQSPPLTPILLSRIKPVSTGPEVFPQSGQIRGN